VVWGKFVFSWINFKYKSNTTGATCGAGTENIPENLCSPPVFSGVRVARYLVFYVVFCILLLSFCPSFGHSTIYGFWLLFWYVQTFLEFLISWIIPMPKIHLENWSTTNNNEFTVRENCYFNYFLIVWFTVDFHFRSWCFTIFFIGST